LNSKRDSYHHGNLRSTLITIGVELLAQNGAKSLSLRSVAKQAGVSHNAPYQHFADKEALLAAIAEQGFLILSAYIDASQIGLAQAPAQQRLIAAGQSYVQFAIGHPAHLEVMFGQLESSQYPDLAQAAFAALERLVVIAGEGQARGEIRNIAPADVAMTIWMLVHGLSAVLIAQKVPPWIAHGREPLELTENYIRLAYTGLANASDAH
jgi:AcrR family transcriptional regulator